MTGELVGNVELSPKVMRTLETEVTRTHYKEYDPDNPQDDKKLIQRGDVDSIAEVLKEEATSVRIPLPQVGPAIVKRLEPLFAPSIGHAAAKSSLMKVAKADKTTLARVGFKEGLEPGSIQGVATRTVLGASESIPVRALSYLAPSLHLAEAIAASKRYEGLPQVQFFIMGTAGATINGFDHARVQDEVGRFLYVARAYVNQFHPTVKDSVTFSTDEHFFDHEEVGALVELLVADESVEGHPLYPRSTSFTDRSESKRYAALHPLVHDLGFSEAVFVDSEGQHVINNPRVILNVGAQSEERFYGARLAFRPVLERLGVPIVPSVQIITSHNVPPYIPLRDTSGQVADISLAAALHDPSIIPSIEGYSSDAYLLARDLKLLREDTNDNFQDFLTSLR